MSRSALANFILMIATLALFFLGAETVTRLTGRYSFEPEIPPDETGLQRYKEPFMRRSSIPGLLFEFIKGKNAVNSKGFRGPEFAEVKTKRRVVALGDSVTNGFLSGPADQSWPYMLGRLFAKENLPVEVINEGVIGYNIEQELIHFRNFGLQTEPDLVVLGITIINDFEEKILLESDNDELVVQVIPRARAIGKASLLPKWADSALFSHSHFYRFLNDRLAWILSSREFFHIGKEKNLKALDELIGLLKEGGIPLYVVIFPPVAYRWEEYPGWLKNLHAELHAFLTSRGVSFRDYFFLIRDHDLENIRKGTYCHFNAEGNRIISREVLADIKRRFPTLVASPAIASP